MFILVAVSESVGIAPSESMLSPETVVSFGRGFSSGLSCRPFLRKLRECNRFQLPRASGTPSVVFYAERRCPSTPPAVRRGRRNSAEPPSRPKDRAPGNPRALAWALLSIWMPPGS